MFRLLQLICWFQRYTHFIKYLFPLRCYLWKFWTKRKTKKNAFMKFFSLGINETLYYFLNSIYSELLRLPLQQQRWKWRNVEGTLKERWSLYSEVAFTTATLKVKERWRNVEGTLKPLFWVKIWFFISAR